MKIRIKFTKTGSMRYVGHLDFMRYFQKALRRAGIALRYSEGYHPHPILSFALPLGIGLTTEGDYLDIEVLKTRPSAESLRAINAEMVEGVTATEYVLMPDDAKKAMASVAAADYLVSFHGALNAQKDTLLQGIPEYFDRRNEIPVTKETRKGERGVDLKPLLYRLEPCENDSVFLSASAGSIENIRPELVLSDLCAFLSLPFSPLDLRIHRLELYETSDAGLRPLSAAGKPILTE